MNYVLHVGDLKAELYHGMVARIESDFPLYASYITHAQTPDKGINYASVMALLDAMAIDYFNHNARWMRTTNDRTLSAHEECEAQLMRMIPRWDNPGDPLEVRFQFEISSEVVDVVWEQIKLRLDMITEGTSEWVVWYTRRVGSDLLIEKGEDFRILDWNRRIENQIWVENDAETDVFRKNISTQTHRKADKYNTITGENLSLSTFDRKRSR